MNKVKVKFLGFWDGFDERNNKFYNILKKHFEVEISDTPDFLFFTPLCYPYEYCKYNCVRIFYSGENYSPDFNTMDYAISFDRMEYGDRYIRFPHYLMDGEIVYSEKRALFTRDMLNSKARFCSFIFSHPSFTGNREVIFELLSKYKHIDSAGTFMNNMPDGKTVPYNQKHDFLKDYKFNIAFESTSLRGFITEKITHAFASTVPVYFGAQDVDIDFNTRAFINCHEYGSFDEAVKKIAEIDGNDEAYLNMMNEPVFVQQNFVSKSNAALEEFLVNILSQAPADAIRRPLHGRPEYHNNYLMQYREFEKAKKSKLYKYISK